MARLNKPDMPPKCTKKVRLGIYSNLISQEIRTVDKACDFQIPNLGKVIEEIGKYMHTNPLFSWPQLNFVGYLNEPIPSIVQLLLKY